MEGFKVKKNIILILFLISTLLLLAACNGGTEEMNPEENTQNGTEPNTNEEEFDMDHSEMNMSSSGEVPKDLAEEENPTYPVSSEAIMNADHMTGMNGAVATVEGAYDTTVYSVTYTPTTGGEKVENHKWVIHEEIENAEEQPYGQGNVVVLNTDHMEGMEGATATIDSAGVTTVYMVSYEDAETGEEVTNHKWVTEEELSPVN